MARLTRDQMLMQIAGVVAQRGTCDRAQVGAVIALEGRIVSVGYVGSPPGQPHCLGPDCPGILTGCERTQHAESNAIAWAARNGIALAGSTLYVTLQPCVPCAKLIITAGIERVVYRDPYRKPDGLNYLNQVGIPTTRLPLEQTYAFHTG